MSGNPTSVADMLAAIGPAENQDLDSWLTRLAPWDVRARQ